MTLGRNDIQTSLGLMKRMFATFPGGIIFLLIYNACSMFVLVQF